MFVDWRGTMHLNIWVVVVNFNGLEDTRLCLASLRAVEDTGLSIVVVDNASRQDPTEKLQSEFPWCHLVRNPVNGGWAGGNNTGIRYALERGADQVILLNNDTIVAPRLVEALLAMARARPEFGILGPIIRFMDDPDETMTDGTLFNRPTCPGFFQRLPVPTSSAVPPAVTEVDIVNGCCMMIRSDVFQRIGLIDERFFLIHEESDFCLRARRAGFHSGVISEALVWHKGSTSFKRTGKRLQRYYDTRNLYLLLRKHPASLSGGRGAARSLVEYLKYSYYRYSLEREGGQDDAAMAVLEGLYDALARQFGPFVHRQRPLLPLLRNVFNAWHNFRSGRKEARSDAAPVC
jgi:GT2 family glycosyltransferase